MCRRHRGPAPAGGMWSSGSERSVPLGVWGRAGRGDWWHQTVECCRGSERAKQGIIGASRAVHTCTALSPACITWPPADRPRQSPITPHLLGHLFAVPPPHMTSLLCPAMTEHPGLTFVTALYRCRELGAALERFASAGTLYNVRRSLAAGAGGQCPRGGVNCAQGRMPGPVRPAAAAAGAAANWRRQHIQVGVDSAARRVPGRPGQAAEGSSV